MIDSPEIQEQTEFSKRDAWQENFLQRILILSAVIGIFALIPAVLNTDNLTLKGIYVGVFVTLVTAILIKMPYLAKAYIFIALPFILGVSSLSETGIRGDVLFFFLAFVAFSALLIGHRVGIATIIISELSLTIMGYLLLSNYYSLSDKQALVDDITGWLSAGFSFLLISSVVMVGLRMVQEGYDQSKSNVEKMVVALRESQLEMEKRVVERTQELTHKTEQLNASTHVVHEIASMQDLDDLLNRTVNLISEQFGFYHTAVYLMNIRGDYVVLQAASSEGGKQLMDRGYRLRVGTEGIVGSVAAEKRSHLAFDVGDDAVYFDVPELAETRSELSLPLIVRNKVIGVLDMQSSETRAFRYDEVELFQTMADQIAATIENTRLLTESQLVISQLDVILNEETRQSWITEVTSKSPAFQYSVAGVKAVEKPKHGAGCRARTGQRRNAAGTRGAAPQQPEAERGGRTAGHGESAPEGTTRSSSGDPAADRPRDLGGCATRLHPERGTRFIGRHIPHP